MEEFMLKDFKNHSSINGEFIKFMVQNNNSDEVTTYRTELACVESKMNSIKLEQSNKIRELNGKFESTSKIAVNASNKISKRTHTQNQDKTTDFFRSLRNVVFEEESSGQQ